MQNSPALKPKNPILRVVEGFTLVEILVVVAILGIISVGALFSLSHTNANQSLVASGEQLADVFRQAHIFSRESRDTKTWGVRDTALSGYELVSYMTDPTLVTVEKSYPLERNITFRTPFLIWFTRGSGEAVNTIVELETPNGVIKQVHLLETGVVNVK